MDVASIVRLLEQTLSQDNDARKSAETTIKELQASPGWPSGLLQVISAPLSTPTQRLASALALKRAALSIWHSDEPGTQSPYPNDVKDFGACVRGRETRAAAAPPEFPLTARCASPTSLSPPQ